MITAAAGMASTGLVPYVATFASFSAILGAEQIRTDCAYPRMPVRIVGTHSGMSMGYYGTSHHALEDLGMMRPIADLTIVCAADANQLRAVLRASVDHPGAIYIRLGRGRDPVVYEEVPEGFAIGRAARLREGRDLTIVATGSQVRAALDAAEALAEGGVEARVDRHAHDQAARPGGDRGRGARDGRRPDGGGAQRRGRPRLGRGRGAGRPPPRPVPPPRGARHGTSRSARPAALYAHYRLDAAGVAAVAGELLGRV